MGMGGNGALHPSPGWGGAALDDGNASGWEGYCVGLGGASASKGMGAHWGAMPSAHGICKVG